ncbi:MAG TPA: hypothetical protein VLW49_10075 [Gaiellaceae bacterium]|nr:hypothetical protein [Gaiellaceae bacterium]
MPRVALVLPPLALVLTACGGSGGSKPTTSASTGAVQSPPRVGFVDNTIARTSKVPVHTAFSGVVTTSGQTVRLSGSGDVDPKSQRGSMHMSISLAGQRVPFDEVLDSKTVYVSSTFLQSFLPSGKKWLEVSLASASNLGAAGFALTSQPGAVPPLKDVQSLGGGKYSGRVDAAKLSPAEQAAVSRTHVKFGAIDVWIGADSYVHRVEVRSSSSAGGKTARIVLTTTMSNFGKPIHVTTPPASETVNANSLSIPGFSS